MVNKNAVAITNDATDALAKSQRFFSVMSSNQSHRKPPWPHREIFGLWWGHRLLKASDGSSRKPPPRPVSGTSSPIGSSVISTRRASRSPVWAGACDR